MWWSWHSSLLCATLIQQALALHESDVGVIDWHQRLIGLPNLQAPLTLPSFHRVRNEATRTTSSVVITGTRSNVLAGVDPMNGTLIWRHSFAPSDPLLSYRAQPMKDLVVSHSGPGGANVRLFTALTGELLCEMQQHSPEAGNLEEPAWLGTAIAFGPEPDIFYTLSNGNTVTKLNTQCEKLWTWASPDDRWSVFFVQLLATDEAIYLAGMASSAASYTLHLASISPTDGSTIQNFELPYSVEQFSTFSFLTYTSDNSKTSASALILLEKSTVKHIKLDPDLSQRKKVTKLPGTYTSLVSFGSQYNGHIVAQKEEGTAHILRLREDSSIDDAWTFSGSNYDSYTGSPPLFSAGIDRNGKIYVSRTVWSFNMNMGSMTVYSDGEDGRGLEHGITFPFKPAEQGVMLHIALDASSPRPMMVSPRYVISTSLGGFQLWDREYLKWTREEALTEIVKNGVQFVELPLEQKEEILTAGSFVHRLQRQLTDLQNLPSYLLKIIQRFATGNYSNLPKRKGTNGNGSTELFKDVFGFHKVILAASASGKVYAIDSVTGEIIFSRVLSLGGSPGATFRILRLFITRGVADSTGLPPEAALIITRISQTGATTLLYTFEALTGKPTRGAEIDGTLEGTVLFDGIAQDAYLMAFEKGKLIVVVDENDKVHLHPKNELTKAALAEIQSTVHAPYLETKSASHRLTGHRLSQSSDTFSFQFDPTWTLSLPPSHRIHSIFKPPSNQPIASFGKTLANRTTLYKYLNPHLVGAVSAAPSSLEVESRCMLHILDGVTGHVVYRVDIPAEHGKECNVKAAMVENWLIYHYWESGEVGAPGWRIVSVEMYEGTGANERHRSSELSSYARDSIPITIFERAFVFPKDITALTFTTTANGITVKDLVVATTNGQIQTFPRRLLDPRRPSAKPSSKEMEEEWLIQYDPLIPDDPRRIISHKYSLATGISSIRSIYTSPTSLESTSLVFGHGLDLFFSRVSPSGTFDLLSENFNKAQLVFTLVGLAVAIMITGPMVRRKKLREKWYSY